MEEKTVKTKKGMPQWLLVTLCVILAIAVIISVFVFCVYRGLHIWMTSELGQDAPPATAFVRDGREAEYVGGSRISLTDEANYLLTIDHDGSVRKVLLIVRDTKAPTAKSADKKITIDDTITPEQALSDLYDASEYTASWVEEPKFGEAGTYEVGIKLTDVHENEDTVTAKLTILGAAERVVYEAGTAKPTLDDFMIVEREEAEIVTDMETVKWNIPGEYEIVVAFDGKNYSSILEIVDTVAPVPDSVSVATLKDTKVSADAFTFGFNDATEVVSVFAAEPDVSKSCVIDCKLRATDMGGNVTEYIERLVVADAIVELEAANASMNEESIKALIPTEYADYTINADASELSYALTSLGAHPVILSNEEGGSAVVAIVVKDTVAPVATGIDCPCSTGYYCDPMKFVTDVIDMSTVKASFVEEPDWSLEGEQPVQIVLTDRSGNSTTVDAKAVISPDKTAPAIYAARDRYCYVGDAVAYFKEIFAEDNADPSPKLDVDKSKVDPKTAGAYDVTYTATDAEGNSSSVTVKFTFIEKSVTEEMLKAEVKKVTDKIFTDDMSKEEKALAVFNYCYNNMVYSGSSNKTDLRGEAYKGLTQGYGDCFTFYSTTYTLLNEIEGIQVLSVERINGKTQHFWCLVNLGTGWYHFDTCNVGPQGYRCFMRMTSDLTPLSIQYWRFDESLYPAVATTPFVMP